MAARTRPDLAAVVAVVKPVRLQLSRAKGFDLQKLSSEMNKLPAVNVARPTKWGNPFRVDTMRDASQAVAAYRERLMRDSLFRELRELRGKNLACWCKPGDPCHADVLLELANR
ncbi:MAG: DUF4326 domain-containing protein [Alphaproteobacteria bacterium]|nr:DUF4326 domain-containing protein [Alphaproteobacteria bacterium]